MLIKIFCLLLFMFVLLDGWMVKCGNFLEMKTLSGKQSFWVKSICWVYLCKVINKLSDICIITNIIIKFCCVGLCVCNPKSIISREFRDFVCSPVPPIQDLVCTSVPFFQNLECSFVPTPFRILCVCSCVLLPPIFWDFMSYRMSQLPAGARISKGP